MVDQKQMVLDWLNAGALWKEGVLLFKALFGSNHPFISLIRKSGSQLKFDILKQVLVSYSLTVKTISFEPIIAEPKTKLREDFAFLNEKDCPAELKILAADKITAYHNYTAAHVKLFDCSTNFEQLETVRQVVENYLENRRILKEFEHYKKNRELLGKHPVFKLLKRIQEFRKMKLIALIKLRKKIANNIWRIQSEIDKKDKPHLLAERLASLEFKKQELVEIDRILDQHD